MSLRNNLQPVYLIVCIDGIVFRIYVGALIDYSVNGIKRYNYYKSLAVKIQ